MGQHVRSRLGERDAAAPEHTGRAGESYAGAANGVPGTTGCVLGATSTAGCVPGATEHVVDPVLRMVCLAVRVRPVQKRAGQV